MSRLPFSGADFSPAANHLQTQVNALKETCARLRQRNYQQQRKIADLQEQLASYTDTKESD